MVGSWNSVLRMKADSGMGSRVVAHVSLVKAVLLSSLVSLLLLLVLLLRRCFGGWCRGARLVGRWGLMILFWLICSSFYPPEGASGDNFLSAVALARCRWAPIYCHFLGISSISKGPCRLGASFIVL